MTLRLHILPLAEYDAQAIFNYIASRSHEGAIRWWQAFDIASSGIVENVDRFSLAPENGLLEFELKQYLFKTPHGRKYRGIFVVIDGEVRIVRVRGPGQPNLKLSELPLE